jgi:hypothetical protein
MRNTFFPLLIVILFLFPLEAQAGWVITKETLDGFGNKSYKTVFIEDSLMRFETPSSVSIFNLNSQLITLIFPQHQAYWHGTASQLRAQIFDIADRQMQELIQHAPASQQDTLRKIYAKARKERMQAMDNTEPASTPDVSIIKTNQTATILGYPTRMYQVNVNSVLVEELWITQAINPFEGLNLKAMEKLMGAIDPISGKAYKTKSERYNNLRYHGLVLKSLRFFPDGEKQTTVVKHVQQVNIKETIFEIPANYVKSKIQEVMLQDINHKVLTPPGMYKDQGDEDMPTLPPPFKVPKQKRDSI